MKKSTLPFFALTAITDGDGGTDEEVEVGADETQEVEEETGDTETSEDKDDEGSEQLGDAGKQALDRMKNKWREERRKRQELEKQLRGADQEDAPKPDEQAAAILERANQKILRSEIKAAAAGKLNDPADAYRFLNLEEFEVTDDGEVDEDEIVTAIESLIADKPYLAAQPQGERRFKGSAGQGVRKGSGPKQLTEADLERMSAEQIEKARRSGQLDKVLGITRHL